MHGVENADCNDTKLRPGFAPEPERNKLDSPTAAFTDVKSPLGSIIVFICSSSVCPD